MNDYILKMYCWVKNQKGQGMVEYGLILALISVVAVVTLTAVGTNVDSVLKSVKDALIKPAG